MPFKREPHNATLSVGGSSQWCAFNNAALCKRTASCICPRSLNAACFSGPLNSNSELLQVVNMVIAVFVTHWILNEDLGKTFFFKDLQSIRKMGINTQERQVVHPSSANLFFISLPKRLLKFILEPNCLACISICGSMQPSF